MVNLKQTQNHSSASLIQETDLNKSSSDILDYVEHDILEKKKIQQRCKSAFNVNISPNIEDDCQKDSLNIPENRLRHLSGYQARVQASTDKLNIPSWYKNSSNRPTSSLASSSLSSYSTPSWRSSLMTTSSLSSASSSSNNSYSHWRTMKNISTQSNHESKKESRDNNKKSSYCGWRSNVDQSNSSLVISPSQRLAKTLV